MITRPRSNYLLIGVLLLIWACGMRDAILGGLQPGYVLHTENHPYPVKDVVVICTIITCEFALLFAILRPFNASQRRTINALIVFSILLVADFSFFSGATDQPGYGYSNGFFLSLVVAFLVVTAVYRWIFN